MGPHKLVRFVIFSLAVVAVLKSSDTLFRQRSSKDSGINWVHESGRSKERYLPETIPPGVAIFDYNNDGRMDILLVNTGESKFFHPDHTPRTALYRNNGDGTFTDVAAAAGIQPNFFGMGVSIGDYDGDGYDDIFLTGYERCYLYHNNRDGTFRDVTKESGIDAPGWSTGAVWFDYNNDGKLDLFVAQFVNYSGLNTCTSATAYGGHPDDANDESQHYYCFPKIFEPTPSHLYRNDGQGHFTDVSRETGILEAPGKAFGVVVTDINNDGFLDLFVANDTERNFLFVNRGGKRFDEISLASGVGYSEDGQPRSGMGVDAADFDGDGKQDLFVANVDQQTFSIYRNNGDESFTDVARQYGIAGPTRLLSGWGLKFFDYDNDGFVDLILANGHPDDLVDMRTKGVTYREPLLLFHNEAGKTMTNVSPSAGAAFSDVYAARGLAVGDLDNDGFPDVVVGVCGGKPLVLYNTAQSGNRWVGLKLKPVVAAPGAAGALIRWSANGVIHTKLRTAGGSYLSSHDPREILGLGKASKADWIEVRWPSPSGRVDRIQNVTPGRYLEFEEAKR
jgi:enediyne biosynthesis protein E4